MKAEIQQLLLEDKTDQAKQLIFSLLSQSKGEDFELYLLLGSTYAMETNNELAIQYFNKAYELAPSNYDVVLTIANFFIANGANSEAKQLMDNYINQATAAAISPATATTQQEEVAETEFDYMDFILGGGDALSYEYDKNSERKTKPKPKTPAKQPTTQPSVYQDLILNDNINDILNKHDLSPIDTHSRINQPVETQADSTISQDKNTKPRLLFTMYG